MPLRFLCSCLYSGSPTSVRLYVPSALGQGILENLPLVSCRDAHDRAVASEGIPLGWLTQYFFGTALSGDGATLERGAHHHWGLLAQYQSGAMEPGGSGRGLSAKPRRRSNHGSSGFTFPIGGPKVCLFLERQRKGRASTTGRNRPAKVEKMLSDNHHILVAEGPNYGDQDAHRHHRHRRHCRSTY